MQFLPHFSTTTFVVVSGIIKLAPNTLYLSSVKIHAIKPAATIRAIPPCHRQTDANLFQRGARCFDILSLLPISEIKLIYLPPTIRSTQIQTPSSSLTPKKLLWRTGSGHVAGEAPKLCVQLYLSLNLLQLSAVHPQRNTLMR